MTHKERWLERERGGGGGGGGGGWQLWSCGNVPGHNHLLGLAVVEMFQVITTC